MGQCINQRIGLVGSSFASGIEGISPGTVKWFRLDILEDCHSSSRFILDNLYCQALIRQKEQKEAHLLPNLHGKEINTF
jgi:hypothetical protein